MIIQTNRTRSSFNKGALMKLQKEGIYSPVCIIDIKSFYPNIIIANRLSPKNDNKNTYLKIITKLKDIKEKGEILGEPIENIKKVKIVMESFIGCLNNPNFYFYDPELYNKIIKEGRRIFERVLSYLKNKQTEYESNGKYFEIIRWHTDGIILRVTVKDCINDIVPYLNEFLTRSETHYYQFRYEGYYMRGIFKNVNNFALFKEGEPLKVKGQFFSKYPELTEAFLRGCYPKDFTKYEELKIELLKIPSPKLFALLDFLEKHKPPYLGVKGW